MDELKKQSPCGAYIEYCKQGQPKDCGLALAHGNGGVLSSECTVIFGGPATV